MPVSRGILSTLYVTLPEGVTDAEVRQIYAETYAAEPFVFLLPAGEVATLAHTVHTNYCAIGLTPVPGTRTLIVTVEHRQPRQGRVGAGDPEHESDVWAGRADGLGLRMELPMSHAERQILVLEDRRQSGRR